MKRFRIIQSRKPFLTEGEVARILAAVKPRFRPAYLLLAHTGMRLGEVRHLEWDDVDFNRNVVKIQVKPDWQPKAGEREVPMSAAIREEHYSVSTESAARASDTSSPPGAGARSAGSSMSTSATCSAS